MNYRNSFARFSRFITLFVFLVILAGGVVRMTQSGMGCPDWPKCFGSWIPPVTVSQLPPNYKELYAFKYVDTSFNPYHTWIEYINRLLGAILGLLLMIQFLWSLRFRKSDKNIVWLSAGNLLLTGFQGWLGSKVVEANLEVFKVTTHMLIALLIAALAVTIVHRTSRQENVVVPKKLKLITWLGILVMIVQIVFGTQVREQIDHIAVNLDFEQRNLWISRLGNVFFIHRSFSVVVALICCYLFFQFKKFDALSKSAWGLITCVVAIIFLGFTMAYFNIPAVAQPLHLLFSSMLIIIVYYNSLRTQAVGIS